MTNTKRMIPLADIKAPKALQQLANGGYVLRQCNNHEEGTPVFGGQESVMPNIAAEKTAPLTKKQV